MPKIVFMGAGSSVFVKNVVGDCMLDDALQDSEFALYDIDPVRLEDSRRMLEALRRNMGCKAVITSYLGAEHRREALRGAKYVINAIQVGLYRPCTVTDFEVPRRFGLRQTIGDTLGIGGIFRALRTIPVLEDFARDIMEECPDAWFLNYTNPMAILTGYMQRFTPVKTVGLCHSVQVCAKRLLEGLGMDDDPAIRTLIAGINHQAWLLDIRDRDGNDLYPEIRRRAAARTEKHADMVRYEIMKRFGYYTTESSEHNAEYVPFFIKDKYPELIDRFNIPLDEYPRRCEKNIVKWVTQRDELTNNPELRHELSREYASHIIAAMETNTPLQDRRQCDQQRADSQPAGGGLRGGALPGGWQRRDAVPCGKSARAVRRPQPRLHQCAAADHSGGKNAAEGLHLSGRHDGPAPAKRAVHRRYCRPVRRDDRSARRMAAGIHLTKAARSSAASGQG